MGIVVISYIFAFFRWFFFQRTPRTNEDATQVQAENVTILQGDIHIHGGQVNDADVEELGEKLREQLRKENSVLIGTREFWPVPIDIIREKGAAQEEFGRCGMIQGWILSGATIFLAIQELFSAAKREAEEKAITKTINQTARDNYVAKHGNIVGVVGIAGIGKTTLGHQHLELVTQEYENVPDGYVFHISLRDFDYNVKMNVLQFLIMSSIPDWKHDSMTDKALLEYIAASQNVHIIMDALDEAKMADLSLNAPAMNLYDTATPDVIFKNLTSGHLLTNAHKMVISRPKAFDQLADKSKPNFVVKALGLGEESQQLLFKRMCSNQADFEEINRQLSLNPIIKALCFVPVFLKVFKPYALKHRDGNGVYSLADVFVSFLEDCVESELFRPDPLELFKLFELAFVGTSNQKYLFDENDLSKHSINNDLVDSFQNLQIMLNTTRIRILAGYKKYFFSHLNWQEFFSGLFLMYHHNLVNFRDQLKNLMENDHWEVVMRFLFGLTNPKVHEKIVRIFSTSVQKSPRLSQVCVMREVCANMADDYSRSLQDFTFPIVQLADYKCYQQWDAFRSQPSDTRLLKLCSFAFESKDPEITESIVGAIPDKILLSGTILPSDVIYLCHVLSKVTKQVCLTVGLYCRPATFVGQGLKVLLETNKGKITKCHMRNANIEEAELLKLARHIPQMEELGFNFCKLTSNMIKIVTDQLMKRTTQIGVFVLSGNRVDDQSMFHITRCLDKIIKLDLRKNESSITGFHVLANSIAALRQPLKWLSVSENHLESSHLQYLSICVHQLEMLTMRTCQIKGTDLKPLTDAIHSANRKMRWLAISNNEIGKKGLDQLANCIKNVEALVITKCAIGGNDLEKLTGKIAALQNPMDWLQLSENVLHDSGAVLLSNCISNINSLSMRSCNLTDNQMKVISRTILQRSEPMGLLDISFNPLGDDTAKILALCLPNITRLELYGCCFTETGRQFILSSLDLHKNCCQVNGLEQQENSTATSSDKTTAKSH